MIFFKKKIIFVHVPRCGGTSIEKNLWKNEFNKYFSFENNDEKHLLQCFVNKYGNKYQSDGLQHLTFKNISMIYPNEVRDFFKFSFVRNPFSRAASLYCEIMKYRKDLRDFLIVHKDSSFKKFLNLIKKNHHTHWMPMVNFFSINNLDFLGRFEDYKNDLDKLSKKINVEFLNKNFSDNLNFSKKINYLNFYKDKDNINLVSEIYKNDLETFNYTFENFEQYEKNKKNTLSIEPYIKLSDKETRFVRYFKRFIKKKIYLIFKSKNF